MLGLIFEKAQNRIQDPAKLRRLIVELIGREDWSAMTGKKNGVKPDRKEARTSAPAAIRASTIGVRTVHRGAAQRVFAVADRSVCRTLTIGSSTSFCLGRD